MSFDPFRSLINKIERAVEHIDQLERIFTPLTDCDQNTYFGTRIDPDNGDLTVYCKCEFGMPFMASILAGEAVHQLRSCLDYLIWNIVLTAGNTPTSRNQFPICDTPQKFKSEAKKKLEGVPLAFQAEIEKLQPYYGGDPNNHAFRVLHELDIIDKHRSLNIIAVNVRGYEYLSVKGDIATIQGRNFVPLRCNEVLLRFKGRTPETKLIPEFKPIISVVFGEVTGIEYLPVIPALRQIREMVEQCVKFFYNVKD